MPSNEAPDPIIIDSDEEIINDGNEEEDEASRGHTEPDQITIESSEEEKQPSSSTKIRDHAKKHKTTDLLALCPLSTPQAPCDRCKVEKFDGSKVFTCHCGAKSKTLKQGRVEKAVNHWKTGESLLSELSILVTDALMLVDTAGCVDKTKKLLGTAKLTDFFKRPAESSLDIRSKAHIKEVPCSGLTDKTWRRPSATYSIAHFMEKTCSIYRGNLRYKVCTQLFGPDAKESNLMSDQKAKLLTALDSQATWEVKRHAERSAIYSRSCTKTIPVRHLQNSDDLVCDSCQNLKHNRSLIRAINSKYAKDDHIRYIPKTLMSADAFHATLMKHKDLQILQKSLESSSRGDWGDFMHHLAISARNGLLKNREAFCGLIKAVAIKAERESEGKTTRGMRINSCLDDCLTTLGAMSSSALSSTLR